MTDRPDPFTIAERQAAACFLAGIQDTHAKKAEALRVILARLEELETEVRARSQDPSRLNPTGEDPSFVLTGRPDGTVTMVVTLQGRTAQMTWRRVTPGQGGHWQQVGEEDWCERLRLPGHEENQDLCEDLGEVILKGISIMDAM